MPVHPNSMWASPQNAHSPVYKKIYIMNSNLSLIVMNNKYKNVGKLDEQQQMFMTCNSRESSGAVNHTNDCLCGLTGAMDQSV